MTPAISLGHRAKPVWQEWLAQQPWHLFVTVTSKHLTTPEALRHRVCWHLNEVSDAIYGRPVTREVLSVVEQGEDALRNLGFVQFRVRHHGEIVRIEIAREELSRALDPRMAYEFTRIFKALGFKFVTLDLEGFRSGSMNTLLPTDLLRKPTV